MLGRIDRPVLSAGTAEAYRQVAEPSLHISFDRRVHQRVCMFQKRKDFSVFFQKADNRFVQSGKGFVAFVFTGIIYGTAIEYITASVTCRVVGYAFLYAKLITLTVSWRFFSSSLNCFNSVSSRKTEHK